jgi:hypothetical protein
MGQPFFLTSIICATLEDLSCTSKQRLNSVLMDPVRIVGLRIPRRPSRDPVDESLSVNTSGLESSMRDPLIARFRARNQFGAYW